MTGIVFIPSTNEFINFEHVIYARYAPAHIREAGVDEFLQEYPEKSMPSQLIIVTSEIEIEVSYEYEDTANGVASSSVRHVYKGNDADILFDAMKSWSINLSQ